MKVINSVVIFLHCSFLGAEFEEDIQDDDQENLDNWFREDEDINLEEADEEKEEEEASLTGRFGLSENRYRLFNIVRLSCS